MNNGAIATGMLEKMETTNARRVTSATVLQSTITTNGNFEFTPVSTETIRVQNVSNHFLNGHKMPTEDFSPRSFTTSTTSSIEPHATATLFSSLTREERTLRLLFPNLRNSTDGAGGSGLFAANGLLALLLTNLVSNDNIGVIAASLINRRTPAATGTPAAQPAMPVKNIANNFYGVGAPTNPQYTHAYASGYPYYYGYGYAWVIEKDVKLHIGMYLLNAMYLEGIRV
ncbi:unnamed protein product [Ceratitis capitata]|uniref:(Mediterranean fruit fly) hypothetical protein n=1 Tax=Ceratitis capitata TaxID=7213 RepID=A0A811TXE9_CERCA|nr:unnamed protein product [Ceratitis capitata]